MFILCLLLAGCDDNTPLDAMENIAGALNTSEVAQSRAVPVTVLTEEADSPSYAGTEFGISAK
ncbi:hypothetical protein [Paenibacillus sp. PastF-1]|uniref:hypothetical protein n=1 Tax=Paenibacillus sp. PastF-1 TaxID=2940531 RepID=UPI0024058472|nr:hypothetical protein [Paenibacillus sp. PastF-1]